MCIIAYAKQNVEFNANELINCWNNNPDGAGVMWTDEKGVHIKKGLMTLMIHWLPLYPYQRIQKGNSFQVGN